MTDTVQHVTEVKTDRQKEADNALVFSYMTLRNLIGLSGMLLPVVLIFTTSRNTGDKWIEPSISDYYYTSNGDVVVVMLSVLGVFLFTYKGYNWKENALTLLAALCSIGVAFSPTVTKYTLTSYSVHTPNNTVPTLFGIEQHLFFAGLFFLALAIISLVYFPKTDKRFLRNSVTRTTAKEKRNVMYKVCGWIMLLCIGTLAVYFAAKPVQDWVGDFPVVFVLETIAIEAFGISWLTKGETLWPDNEHYMVRGYRQATNAIKEMVQS